MVEVSNKHKSITVGVSSNNGNTIVTASSDTSQYWANQSHTFADQSKEYAQESKHYAELTNSYIEGFENVVTNNTNNIIATSNDCINQLTELKDAGVVEINESVVSGKDEINSTKTTIINDIEFVADGEKEEIQELADKAKDDIESTGFYMRDDKLYFINSVGEEEEFKTNDNELNNPFSLLDYKYSEYELNNISWLRSEGQYNSKITHPAVYDLLLKIYNGTETKAGVSVKLITEDYTDYDFVLNTAEETFRLPVRTKDDFVVESKEATEEDPSWYRVYKSGWVEQGGTFIGGNSDGWQTVNLLKEYSNNKYYANNCKVRNYATASSSTHEYVMATANPIRNENKTTTSFESYIYANNSVIWEAKGQGAETPESKTYFYVGETVQNANLINAGRIEEKIADLIPNNSSLISGLGFPSNKRIDLAIGASGTVYTAPANGWFSMLWVTSSTSSYGNLINTSSPLGDYKISTGSGAYMRAFVPARKNDEVQVQYLNMNTASMSFRFIYAEGEEV